MSQLRVSEVLPCLKDKAFELLSNPTELPDLLAPVLEVELLGWPSEMRKGTEVSLKMTRYGFVQSVRFRIEEWDKGRRFSYRQIEGIFKRWVHTELYSDHGDGHCAVTTLVDYELPLGIIGYLADDLFFRGDLMEILSHRLRRAAQRLIS